MWRETDEIELRPWTPGRTGKALVYADGVTLACEDDPRGEPHHEEIRRAAARGVQVLVTLGIAPDGSCTAYSSRYDHDWLSSRLAEHDPPLYLEDGARYEFELDV